MSILWFETDFIIISYGERFCNFVPNPKAVSLDKLNFKSSDIASIYFDEKLAPIDLIKTIKTDEINLTSQRNIFGVVTYFFNKNYGDKHDVGSQVFIADSTNITDINLATIDSFKTAYFYKSIYLSYKSMGRRVKVPENIIEKVKEFNIEDTLVFDAFDKRASDNIYKIQGAKNVIKTVVDGNGNYSVKVNPGTYYVCIKSNNRDGLSMTEVSGKVKCQKVVVKNGVDTNLSYNFELR